MKNRGFTLIELLITIAIIGILAGVAYPSYMQYVLKSKRSEAQSALLDLANRQEMYYLDHHKYAVNLNTELGLSANPFITDNGYYSIATSSAKATEDFTLTATAISTQAADTDCATLSITHELAKSATNTTCWK
ncbi:MAG: type IV pilus assembly protein PilE [Psychromonas sp.]|jgi:type IV pilus assembly protein PilE|uniref:type IV pilin protein n=1 Tax=Psychromonas sp. TaxID=1884585 RepID=UPI0039E3D2B5